MNQSDFNKLNAGAPKLDTGCQILAVTVNLEPVWLGVLGARESPRVGNEARPTRRTPWNQNLRRYRRGLKGAPHYPLQS